MPREGIIQFTAHHQSQALAERVYGEAAAELCVWRLFLRQLELLGMDPRRYEGLGFGNISCRVPPWGGGRSRRAFLITASQTGGLAEMGLEALSLIKAYSLRQGSVESQGLALPSSETLTHAACYEQAPELRWVIHVHCPLMWHKAKALRLPITPREAANGTLELAQAIGQLWSRSAFAERKVAALGGHEDGILAIGRTAREATGVLLEALATAHRI